MAISLLARRVSISAIMYGGGDHYGNTVRIWHLNCVKALALNTMIEMG